MRIVYIKWQDSCYLPESNPAYERSIKELGGTIMETIGFVHHEYERSIALAMELSSVDDDVRRITYIPRGCIQEQRELEI